MTDTRGNEVSALPSLAQPQKRPMVIIPSFPSKAVLEATGRAVALFAQLEYYLVVIYKRAVPGALLPDIIKKRGEDSLGSLLNGVTNRGKDKNFNGLIKIAEEENTILRSVIAQLRKASDLLRVRKKYVHGGIGCRTSDREWVFLITAEKTSEADILNELNQACRDIETLIGQIQDKIPTPKS